MATQRVVQENVRARKSHARVPDMGIVRIHYCFDRWTGNLTWLDSYEVDWLDLPKDGMLGFAMLYDEVSKGGKRYNDIWAGYQWYGRCLHPSGNPLWLQSDDDPERILERYPGTELIQGKMTTVQLMREFEAKAATFQEV